MMMIILIAIVVVIVVIVVIVVVVVGGGGGTGFAGTVCFELGIYSPTKVSGDDRDASEATPIV